MTSPTKFLLHWQWVMMKRQLLTFRGMLPLMMSILFQVGMVIVSLTGKSGDFAQTLSMVLLYIFFFGLMQVMNTFSQFLVAVGSGLLGIAPIPPQAKMAMVLVSTALMAGIQAFVFALAPGILFSLQFNLFGGFMSFLLLLVSAFSLYMGIGTGLVSWLTGLLPVKLRGTAGSLIGVLFIIVGPLMIYLNKHDPRLAASLGQFWITLATFPGKSLPAVYEVLALTLLSLLFTFVPLRKKFGRVIEQVGRNPMVDGREYAKQTAPSGTVRLFIWREWILLRRQKAVLLLVAFSVLMPIILPGTIAIWWFGMMGSQLGGGLYNLGSVKVVPLLYLSPMTTRQFWYKRLASLLPTGLLYCLLLLIPMWLTHKITSFSVAFAGLTLFFAALLVQSFLAVYYRIHDLQLRRKKRQVTYVTFLLFASTLLPMLLGTLDDKFPAIGVVINLGLGALTLVVGSQLIQAKPSLQYHTAAAAESTSFRLSKGS